MSAFTSCRRLRPPALAGVATVILACASAWGAFRSDAREDPGPARLGTTAAAPMALFPMGQVGGATFAVDAHGSLAVFGLGPRLVTADIADPAGPRELGRSEPLGDLVRDVIALEGRAVAAVGAAGVVLVDLTEPAQPKVLDRLDTPGFARGLAWDGRLYVADGPAGLSIASLQGGALRQRGTVPVPDGVGAVTAAGGLSYLLPALPPHIVGPVRLVDATDPDAPRLLPMEGESLAAAAVAVAGDRLYTVGAGGLETHDITEPAAPKRLGAIASIGGSPVNDIAVRPPYMALAFGTTHPLEGAVSLLDVADPLRPELVAWQPVSEPGVRAVALESDRLVAALSTGGFAHFGASDAGLARFETLEVGFAPVAGEAAGETLVLASGRTGLAVVDVARPHAPELEGRYHGPPGGAFTFYSGVALDGRSVEDRGDWRAYATTLHGDRLSTALRVFESSETGALHPLAMTGEPAVWYGPVAVGEGHALVGADRTWPGRNVGLRVFDVASTITPTLAVTVEMELPVAFALQDGHAYVADAYLGLGVLDAADPEAGAVASWQPLRGRAVGVSVSARHLVAVSVDRSDPDRGYAEVFDRDDPSRPAPVGWVALGETPAGVAAGDGWACVVFRGGEDIGDPRSDASPGAAPSGVVLIDLADPARPAVVDRRALAGVGESVIADGDRVYAAMGAGGLHVLSVATDRRAPLFLPVAVRRLP